MFIDGRILHVAQRVHGVKPALSLSPKMTFKEIAYEQAFTTSLKPSFQYSRRRL
ncbi:MAG: hypothetical protein LBI76_08685 [Comamonas sp.]|nr:hypothetical protein [Comamonas sp.]